MNLTLVTRHVLSGVQVPPSLPGRVALGADAGFPSYMEGGSRWGRVLYMKFQDMPALSPCLPPLGILLKEPNPPGAAQDLLIGWKWRAQAQKGGRGNAGLYQSTAKRHRRGGRSGKGWVLLKIPRGIWRGARWRERERRWFVLERPRRDTNGGSETEVTVTSKLPSKYRKKQRGRKEKRRPHPLGAQSEARCQESKVG